MLGDDIFCYGFDGDRNTVGSGDAHTNTFWPLIIQIGAIKWKIVAQRPKCVCVCDVESEVWKCDGENVPINFLARPTPTRHTHTAHSTHCPSSFFIFNFPSLFSMRWAVVGARDEYDKWVVYSYIDNQIPSTMMAIAVWHQRRRNKMILKVEVQPMIFRSLFFALFAMRNMNGLSRIECPLHFNISTA